ncbi:MAG: hypothetical protein LBR70_06020 [Lactobacillaceae bacterium]|jgi:hypothetical protein|nr:hypothetical protein [Lactobacillaceae bacterium]
MLKKLTMTFLVILISACGSWGEQSETQRICPSVLITRNDAYLVQKGLNHEEFNIELIGYEGYCYYDTRISHDKAVVTPIFKIKRLRPNDETDIMFSFYAETVKGPPEYLGKKTYFEKAEIPVDIIETEYRGQQAEVRIPPNMRYEFDINLGLNIAKKDKEYNKRTFDVPLGYEE